MSENIILELHKIVLIFMSFIAGMCIGKEIQKQNNMNMLKKELEEILRKENKK